MPARSDISSILLIGAGPIVIGQACEFDYSGVQAVKALKEAGKRVILVNSNPATIMTDPGLADATYIEPITPSFVEKIIAKEKPDSLLPTMGGQTALNTALELERRGILEKYGVEMIGARAEVIDRAEDRQKFRETMDAIGLESPRSMMISARDQAEKALAHVGLPTIIRPSFTLGGQGGGIAYNREEYMQIIEAALAASPAGSALVEESLLGWKEFEMEVVRDKADNCIIICSIENIDPMGVHTGDSITVAPALTLTDREYQRMRNASIACLRAIGVETGGSNVQFAIHPETGRMVVIEMNPRVSRSSALASKATGFPIAKVAAKLAIGYTLDEIGNDITGGATPASFEPSIDYIVTKIPRFDFEKFKGADRRLTTSMHSVGETMAMGRSFQESLQKALRGLETGLTGLNEIEPDLSAEDLLSRLGTPTPSRLLLVAQALRQGATIDQLYKVTRIDPWFLRQIEDLVSEEKHICEEKLNDAEHMRRLKRKGFADSRLAELAKLSAAEIRKKRQTQNCQVQFKRVDSVAAEFEATTPYLYASYDYLSDHPQLTHCEAQPSDARKVMILGGGPNRIGQGIEFDYCCCHAAFACAELGYESIMVNCNPETVSTDYDTSDRLYFEPLTLENVLDIVEKENEKGEVSGIIVQFGGQTPLKLATGLSEAGVPILGTSSDAIDLAEDRERFCSLLAELGLKQPENAIARTEEDAFAAAENLGYPLILRPSYVLGGRAMEVITSDEGLRRYVSQAAQVSGKSPLLIDKFLDDAIEVDVDAICDGESVFIAGIMEHIEEAGVHSGDSACVLPPFSLDKATLDKLEAQTSALALGLGVRGLLNVQFALRGDSNGENEIFILEANPRASRTVPFVAKATGLPIASIAAKVMMGTKLTDLKLERPASSFVAVKEAVLPFARFPEVDVVLGPEMRSTGEVMGLDKNLSGAFIKSQLASGVDLPTGGKVFVSVKDGDKEAGLDISRILLDQGFMLVATAGTCGYLRSNGLEATPINKVRDGRPHIVDALKNGEIALVINTTAGKRSLEDSFSIRRTALEEHVPYYTTLNGARAAAKAIASRKKLEVTSLQECFQ